MDTECIIKILLLTGIIYLIVSCWNQTENFSYNISQHNSSKPVNITIRVNDVEYVFISFENLKKEYKDKIIANLKENKDFINPKAPAKNENLDDMVTGSYIKIPIFIVKKHDAKELTDDKTIGFMLKGEKKYKLVPVVSGNIKDGEFLYNNEDLEMLYHSNTGNNHVLINTEGFVDNNGITDNRKLKEITFGNLKLNVISKEKISKDDKYNVNMTQ